jgi:ribosomal 30S subunit maturation factor RimM
MIDEARCERALNYLSTSDVQAAELKVESLKLEDKIAALKAAIIARTDGAMELRKAIAETSEDVAKARTDYYAKLLEFEIVKNRRHTATRVTELWQTVASNRRAGMQ